MRKLTIWGILVLAMSVFVVNALASTHVGVCPTWSQKELDRIGTLGGDLDDYEYYYGGSEYCYDREVGAAFKHQALIYKSGGYFFGEYYSTNSTTDVNNVYRSNVLTEDEYNRCKQMLIDHKTKHSSVRPSSASPPYQNRQEEMKREMQDRSGGLPPEILAHQNQSRSARQRRENQDRACGVPPDILALQSNEIVQMPTIDDAVKIALAAAEEAVLPLIDTKFHTNGITITVPDDHKTIQEAINAARSGDVVLVKPGSYYELLVMKDGVKVVSDSVDGGDELVHVEGAMLKLPRRTLRTIIDGSRSKTSHHGMFDFNPGVGRKTIIDGFTIQNLPAQNHHIPGHAHALNVRGASPVITNCLIRNNGSTGIGNHVVYHDQDSPMPDRDFRWANVKHRASAVIFHNVIHDSLGLGIGCNNFSYPYILGNEVFNNSDAELGEDPSPGIGGIYGSAATIIGNIVHDNPSGGILSKPGAPQGKYHIDRPTHPTIMKNVVYYNGSIRAGISSNGGGSEAMPVKIIGNYVFNSGMGGIGLQKGAVGIIENNMVTGSNLSGIAVNDSTALRLNRNKVTGTKKAPGFTVVNDGKVHEMLDNASYSNYGPRFMISNNASVGE